MHRLLERQLKKCIGNPNDIPPQWQRLIALVSDAYEHHDADRELIEHSMDLSSSELVERNQKLAEAELKYRSIFEHATEGIFQLSPEGKFISANPALMAILGYDSLEDLQTAVTDVGKQIYADPGRWNEIVLALGTEGNTSRFESLARRKDGSTIWISETSRATIDAQGRLSHYEGTLRDITQRRQAEQERAEMQSRLIALSRNAGMADIATSVLHNVGNVLNSLNVSVSVATTRIQKSPVEHLTKAVRLLRDHEPDLAAFLTTDNRGKHVPGFLGKAVDILATEQTFLLKEMAGLTKNLEHIKQVVTLQQDYAKKTDMSENVDLAALIEDALNVDTLAFERNRIVIAREFESQTTVWTDKHVILQIILNLISNARHSVIAAAKDEKRITFKMFPHTEEDHSFIVIEVSDNGVGIDPAHLPKVFVHGFTTKKTGHGFGLHTSANAAKQLGGSLSVASAGPGLGATFTLKIPFGKAEISK